MEASGVRIHHPNRDKPESKATKAAVTLLLLTSAGLTAVITFGGWAALQGAEAGAIAYILIYALMAYYVTRWNRGVLPVAAALAVLFAVIAIVAAPGWFERDKAGFEDPALEPGILGLLTLILIPVQLLLIAFALRGFNQEWNVEVEVTKDEAERGTYREGHEEGEDESAGRGVLSEEGTEDAQATSIDRGPAGPESDAGQSPGGGDTRGASGDEGGGTGEDTQQTTGDATGGGHRP